MKSEVNEELIYTNLNFKTREEVLNYLSSKLIEKSLVKSSFSEAIIEREKEYPTGLPSKQNVAIPHADSELVNETSIAVGILDSPVTFKSMDDPDKNLSVQLVIMLAIKEPHGQLEMLQKIISFIQNDQLVHDIIKKDNSADVKEILENIL